MFCHHAVSATVIWYQIAECGGTFALMQSIPHALISCYSLSLLCFTSYTAIGCLAPCVLVFSFLVWFCCICGHPVSLYNPFGLFLVPVSVFRFRTLLSRYLITVIEFWCDDLIIFFKVPKTVCFTVFLSVFVWRNFLGRLCFSDVEFVLTLSSFQVFWWRAIFCLV